MHQLKLYCPTCKMTFLTSLMTVDLPKDLDGPPCERCGTLTELDTTEPAKFTIYTKKRDKKGKGEKVTDAAMRVHRQDILKGGKGLRGYQEASE